MTKNTWLGSAKCCVREAGDLLLEPILRIAEVLIRQCRAYVHIAEHSPAPVTIPHFEAWHTEKLLSCSHRIVTTQLEH